MATIKTDFECDKLWLSETYGGYDWRCDISGKDCLAVRWDKEKNCFVMNCPAKCCKSKSKTLQN